MNADSSEDSEDEGAAMRETFSLCRRVVELVFRNAELEAQATQTKRRILHLESRLHDNNNVVDLSSVSKEVLVVVGSFLTAEDLTNLGRTGK